MSLSQQKRKGYISFILGAVLTAVFSMFFFRSYGDFTVLNDSAPIAIYIISLVFGVFGGLVSYRAFSGGQFAVGDKKFFYPVLSFVITFAAILTAYVLLGIAPFGKETALVIDMYHQYSVFFVDLRERLEAGESLIYSLRLGLGGAFTPMFAYYLASPFNFIAMLFPTSAMSEGVALVELLKIAAAACTFSIFVSCNYGKRDFGVTLVSVMYALSSYIMAYSWNIMWLDCIVMLPLVALGLNKLIREGKYLLYCLSLGICLLSNFYIGFMVCIALVLYFLSIVAAENKISWRAFFSRAGRFALGSVIGGGIAAVLIIPTYMALRLTSSANDVFPSLWQTNFNIADLLSQQYFGMPVGIDYGNLPNIYCGVLAVVLLPVYVLNGKIPVRRKLCELGFLGVMAASLVLNKTDWIWHGLHYPNGLPYRFAFVYIFALLVVCYRGLINLDSSETKHVGSGVAFAAGLLIILQALNLFEDSVRTVITSLLLIAVYGVVLIFGTQRKLKLGAVYGILALVMVFELTCNGILSIRNVNDRFFYADRDGYYNSYAAVTGAADELEGMEENFFRVEHLPSNTCNDNCLYNYNGLTVFSSTNAQRIVNLMDRLGYSNNGVNSHMYRCFEPATDSLLGLKYLITTSNIYNHPQLARVGSVDNDGGTLYVYENKFALPLGTVADVSLMNWNWDTENPFEVINEYYQLATGVSDVFEIIDLELEDETNFNTEYFDGRYISGYPEDYSYYANITASCDIPRDGQVYAYSEVPYMRSQTIYYTDQSIAVSESEPYVADLGIMNAGDRAAINIEVNYMTDGAITMAMLNQENFEKSIAYLNSHKFDEEIVEDGYIKGTVNTGKDGLLVLSVPYDEGWTVYVDGKKSYISPLGSALISVAMPAGKHTVEFKFMTVGLKPGAIISIVSLIVLALICLRKKILTRLYPLMPSKMKAKTMHAGGFKVNRKKEPVFDSDDLQILEDLTNNVKEEPIDDDQQDSKQAETE